MKISKGWNKFLNFLLGLLIVGLVVYVLMTVFRAEVGLFLEDYGSYIFSVLSLVWLVLVVTCFVLSIVNFYLFFRKKNRDFLWKGLRYLMVWPIVLVFLYAIFGVLLELVLRENGVRNLGSGFTTCYMPMNTDMPESVIINRNMDERMASLMEKYKNNIPVDVLEKIDRG